MHYHVQTACHLSPSPPISPCSLILLHKIHLILSCTLCLGLQSTLLPSDFPTKNLYGFLCSYTLATCLTHLIHLDLITCHNIWSGEQIMKPYTTRQLPPFSCYLHWAKLCNLLIFMMGELLTPRLNGQLLAPRLNGQLLTTRPNPRLFVRANIKQNMLW